LFDREGPQLPVDDAIIGELPRSAEDGLILGIRPEFVEIFPAGPGNRGLRGSVFTRQIFGNEILYDIKTVSGIVRSVLPTLPSSTVYAPGDEVFFNFMWRGALAFDPATEQRISWLTEEGSD